MRVWILLILAPLLGCASQAAVQRSSGTTEEPTTVFVDVTVVPMDRETCFPIRRSSFAPDRIADNRARRHGSMSRSGALRIDGHGKYLMPGLADMHSHPESLLDLMLYVANGVTTVRTMGSDSPPDLLHWRSEAAANRVLIPAIYTAGPVLDGPSELYQGGPSVVDCGRCRAGGTRPT